jgi:hypothetical protein
VLRLYVDEDATSRALLTALRSSGVDVTDVAHEQMRGRSDEDQLIFATQAGRAIFSYNVADFMRLHTGYLQVGRSHSGIVLVRQRRYGTGELLRRLVRLATALEPKEMISRVEFLNAWG